MLAYKAFGAGVTGLLLDAMARDVADGLTATGTTRTDAYECTSAVNAFTTVATGTGAILASQCAKGDTQLIYNGGANALKIYPHTGAAINGLPVNTGMTLSVRSACQFTCISTTQWTGVLSA